MERYIGNVSISIMETMKLIDSNSIGTLIIVDDNKKVLGTITDGDIRRYLLSGGKIEECCTKAMNIHPQIAHSKSEARIILRDKDYAVIPIVDDNGIIVDAFVADYNKKRKIKPLDIPVVINAGGKGTRLEPYTRILPKPLVPIANRPIIEHIMNEFKLFSCDDFHIIVNYKKQIMKAYFAENEDDYDITWYDEEKPLGTGGGLSLLKGKINSTFFFSNCDILLRINYASLLKFHKENKNVITMVCAHKMFTVPYGVIDMGVNGKINQLIEKPTMSYLTNTGLYVVEPEVLEDIEDGKSIGFPDIIENQKAKGKKVAIFPVNEGDWMDMGQMSELEKMEERLSNEE